MRRSAGGPRGRGAVLVTEGNAAVDQSTTNDGTPLRIAVYKGHLEVVRWLAVEAGADVNQASSTGWTPVMIAAKNGHLEVVRCLAVEASSDGSTPVMLAAHAGHLEVVRLLIGLGAKTNGARVGSGHAMIRQVLRENLLLAPGAEPPAQARLHLCGFQGIGKSTLMRSLGRSLSHSMLHWGSADAADRDAPAERTPGVDVQRVKVPGVGMLSIWDFAGQVECCATHGLLMGSGLFVVLCSLEDPPAVQREQVLCWLRFIRARFPRAPAGDAAAAAAADPKSAGPQPRPIVILAGSTRDSAHPHSKVASSGTGWSSGSGAQLLAEARQQFAGSLELAGRFFCLDCRQSQGVEMTALRKCLAEQRTSVLARAPLVPKVCVELIKWITQQRSSGPGMLLTERLVDLAAAGLSIDARYADQLLAALGHLHDMGEVIYIEDDPMLARWVVTDPRWFGQTATVIGRVLAPETVAVTAPQVERDGVVSRDELARVLHDAPDVPAAVSFLEHMELCCPVGEGGSLLFPALLKHAGDDHQLAWRAQTAPFVTVGGRRLACSEAYEMLPPQYFPRLQARLARRFPVANMPVWRNGAIVSPVPAVQALLEISADCRHVDVVVRGRSDDDRLGASALLRELVAVAQYARDDTAAGTSLHELALGVDGLVDHCPAVDRVAVPLTALGAADPAAAAPGCLSSGATVLDLLELGGAVAEPVVLIEETADAAWSAQVTCSTPNAEFRFTLDGSEPNRSSALHPSGQLFAIPAASRSLRIRAFRPGMAPSAAVTSAVPDSPRPPDPEQPGDLCVHCDTPPPSSVPHQLLLQAPGAHTGLTAAPMPLSLPSPSSPGARRALNAPGTWDFFVSHTQRNGHATTLAAELYAELATHGLTCWLDVRMEQKSEAAMKEGVLKSKCVLAVITGACDGAESNAYFNRPYCVKELRWAREAGIPIQPVIRAADKQEIGAFLATAPEDLKDLGQTDFIDLDRSKLRRWKGYVEDLVGAFHRVCETTADAS